MVNSSTSQFYNRSLSDSLSTLDTSRFFGRSSIFDSEPTLRETRSGQSLEPRSSLVDSFVNTVKQYFSKQSTLESSDVSTRSIDTDNVTGTTQLSALAAKAYSSLYGDGLVNASAAVARAIGQSPFADVTDLGGFYWGLDRVRAPEVWTKGFSGQNTVVAVVDSGVDFTHPDLDNNIWTNRGEISGNGIDDDLNGYVDDILGWNFAENNNNSMDITGHGTHVAGIIGAETNEFGTVGVAPNSKIMPVRVLGADGQGASSNIAQGIIYAANNGANVINLSLRSDYSPDIEGAVRYATERGAFVVMSSGNKGGSEPLYPAHLATNWGIAVGAVDINNSVTDFTNRAGMDPNLRYVVAPGADVWSTYPGNDYIPMNGTSMAAPFVSGIAALMKSANPNLSPEQMRQILADTAIG
jgi:subtilisin family serine protease